MELCNLHSGKNNLAFSLKLFTQSVENMFLSKGFVKYAFPTSSLCVHLFVDRNMGE